ncbi:MAG TPA: hypothetical protein VJ001_00210, partial [Rhodocyclaceae bacterium]|nr:hypothetical protein [Rhodocyclaceae bacterium]
MLKNCQNSVGGGVSYLPYLLSLLLSISLVLTGCGGGGGAGGSTGGAVTTTSSVTTTTAVPVRTLTSDTFGTTVSNTDISSAVDVSVVLKDFKGNAVANEVITFSTDETLAAIEPKTALTDAKGVATVKLRPASLTANGAGTIKATSQVNPTAVEWSMGYSIGHSKVAVTTPVFGVGSSALSAYGTTSVSVDVTVNATKVTSQQVVTFSSPCASSGKAVLTASVTTIGGSAIASYRDNGCSGTDEVTASVSTIASSKATVTVTPPSTGSIQFVSASPASITLKGMGGLGRQESSQVTFKVVDNNGNPVGGKTVSFSLSTSIGGITLTGGATPTTSTAVSDPITGYAVVSVNSGTISTPVRVYASVASGTSTLTTQSDQLTVTTGIPDQDSTSLSATILNIEGWNYDGSTTVLTMRLADHFNNPVPDGTAVNFTTEGGSVVSSCVTKDGACSATLSSQNPRPTDGRVTVLAYAVGEESFIDLNSNGLADTGASAADTANELYITDANNNRNSTDMADAFRDDSENGVREVTETYIDFNGDGKDTADGKYNGVLCNEAAGSKAGTCPSGTNKSIHVRDSLVVVFSGSNAVITMPAAMDLNHCGKTIGFSVGIVDVNGNIMPAGTKIDFATSNGKLSVSSFVVPSTNVRAPAP